jgi:hypothetical protein
MVTHEGMMMIFREGERNIESDQKNKRVRQNEIIATLKVASVRLSCLSVCPRERRVFVS